MNLLFYFEYNHAKDIIIIKKKLKKEKKEERFKYFERCNVKKYCDKEKFQHFLFNVFEDFYIIRKKFLNT